MGFGWKGGSTASSQLYVDKVVKFISGLLQLLLGVVLVILVHAVSVECEGHIQFSFLVLFQALSLIFILLLWYWCYGQDLANHVQELIHHVNHLTNEYRRYSEGVSRGAGHREVNEARLHTDLDNYLEYLLHVLSVKGERLYTRHLAKWVLILAVCVIWLAAVLILVVTCGLPDAIYLKVLWVLPILILVGTIVLVVFHIVYDLCRPRGYEATFFYQAVPGAMDARLTRIVAETFNPRYVWLLSRYCWQNAHLIHNAGLSKSLARKYGYVSDEHRPDRWRDQHFPTLRSDQLERFKFNAEQFVQSGIRGDAGCCYAVLWCCLDTPGSPTDRHSLQTKGSKHGGRKKWALPDRSQRLRVGAGGGGVYHHHHRQNDDGDVSSGYSSGFRPAPTLQTVAEDGYMTPNLFVRKLAKEAYTPEQLVDEEAARKRREKTQKDRHSRSLRPAQDDLHIAATGPQQFPSRHNQHHGAARGLGLSRDDTEVDYGAFYQPHDLDPHRMQREYDPLTYGVRMSVKKEMAKDVRVWRP